MYTNHKRRSRQINFKHPHSLQRINIFLSSTNINPNNKYQFTNKRSKIQNVLQLQHQLLPHPFSLLRIVLEYEARTTIVSFTHTELIFNVQGQINK